MLDRIDRELAFSTTALNLRAYRQELLASNIANADTPHYKARDVDFKSALGKVMAGNSPQGSLAMSKTVAGHLDGNQVNPLSAYAQYRSEYQGAVDGNTVNMDIERSSFAENSVHMEALLNQINGEFKKLQTAITSQ